MFVSGYVCVYVWVNQCLFYVSVLKVYIHAYESIY